VINIPILLARLCYRYPSMLVDAITDAVARHAGQNRHLAKQSSRLNCANFLLFTRLIRDKDMQLSVNGKVKSVSAPIALTHDHFARSIGQQARIRTDLLAARHFPLGDHFQIVFVFFLEQFRNDLDLLDGFQNGIGVGVFFSHAVTEPLAVASGLSQP